MIAVEEGTLLLKFIFILLCHCMVLTIVLLSIMTATDLAVVAKLLICAVPLIQREVHAPALMSLGVPLQ